MNMACELTEFKQLQFHRDNEYFNEGYASWVVQVKARTYYVHAVYQEQALIDNDLTKDYTNGIKAFEVQDKNYRTIRRIKRTPVEKKSNEINLNSVEEFLLSLK